MDTVYCRVYGRVQMVMFRDFTMRKARKLGLVGFVRNRADGSVEAYAEGSKENLEKWIGYLRRGSLLSRVDRVKTDWGKQLPLQALTDIPHKPFDSFDIVF